MKLEYLSEVNRLTGVRKQAVELLTKMNAGEPFHLIIGEGNIEISMTKATIERITSGVRAETEELIRRIDTQLAEYGVEP